MRILHLITSLKIGGAEQALYNYLKADNHQYEHHVIYVRAGPLVSAIQSLGIPTYHLKGLWSTYDPVTIFRCIQLIKKIRPDILHTSLWSANILGRIIGYFYRIPIIHDLHGSCLHEGKIRNLIDSMTLSLSGPIVAVCDEVKENYTKKIIGTSKHYTSNQTYTPAITVIENGINTAELRQKAAATPLSRHHIKATDEHFVIGTIGRLEWIKGYELLIQAADVLINSTYYGNTYYDILKICIVGDGSEKASLERYVRHFGLSNHVFFAGSRTDAYRFYPLFDCFALSSHSEGLSIALLEALAFELPVIMTHTKTTHPVITHGINGLLVTKRSPALFAQAIDQIVKNTELRAAMKHTNYQHALEKYDIKRVVDQYNDLFSQTYREWHCKNRTSDS